MIKWHRCEVTETYLNRPCTYSAVAVVEGRHVCGVHQRAALRSDRFDAVAMAGGHVVTEASFTDRKQMRSWVLARRREGCEVNVTRTTTVPWEVS